MNKVKHLHRTLKKIMLFVKMDWKRERVNIVKTWLLSAVIGIWSCVKYLNHLSYLQKSRMDIGSISYLECIFQVFQGMTFLKHGAIQLIIIPGNWLIFYIFLFYVNGRYFEQYRRGIHQQVFLRSKSLSVWWLSKYIFMMSHIISYFVISYLSVFFLYACRNLIIPINKNSDYLLTRVNVLETLHIEDLSNLQMMGYFLGLPLFVVIALSSIQSVFAIQGHAVEGCIVIIVYLLISIYWGEWYLLGNYLMLLRSLDTVNGTFPIGKGLVISLVIIFLSYQIGRSKLNKTDFL